MLQFSNSYLKLHLNNNLKILNCIENLNWKEHYLIMFHDQLLSKMREYFISAICEHGVTKTVQNQIFL